MKNGNLTIVDSRTNVTYTLPIEDNTIKATDLRQIKTDADDFGLMTYDPAFMNTASCRSSDHLYRRRQGHSALPRIQHRGTRRKVHLPRSRLPADLRRPARRTSEEELDLQHHAPHHDPREHQGIHRALPLQRAPDEHPVFARVAALSIVYPDSRDVFDPEKRMLNVIRLIAKMPTLAAASYRHSIGLPYVYPDNDLSYTENFMNMLWKMVEPKYVANPVLSRALDVLFILHADHEQNASTSVMRAVGSAQTDPFLCTASAAAALAGPLHGGANEAVLQMLDEIGTKENIPGFIDSVKAGKGKLMGFGHRVYKNYDPRARIIKQVANEVLSVTGNESRSWRSRSNLNASPWKTSTSLSASCIRTWTSTPG